MSVICGDCLDVMGTFPESHFASIITDPPYGLGFMGKQWDHGVPGEPFWREALRVAKPGAMLLAFGGTRTYHRLAVAIEDAGWEIRDCMMWLYGSGFPKSLDISKAIDTAAGAVREKVPHGEPVKRMIPGADQDRTGSWIKDNGREYQPGTEIPATDAAKLWDGWGTALKPAWEPIIVAMKPLDGTFVNNALTHGVAGLHIDGGRIAHDEECRMMEPSQANIDNPSEKCRQAGRRESVLELKPEGRWPANVILDEEAGAMLDEQSGLTTSTQGKPRSSSTPGDGYGMTHTGAEYADTGGASRFFYCAKASRTERGEFNTHPTVKPVDLMAYLCKLTATPTGDGIILDPFCGSGSTLVAAAKMGRPAIGIDLDPHHCDIARRRIDHAQGPLFGAQQ